MIERAIRKEESRNDSAINKRTTEKLFRELNPFTRVDDELIMEGSNVLAYNFGGHKIGNFTITKDYVHMGLVEDILKPVSNLYYKSSGKIYMNSPGETMELSIPNSVPQTLKIIETGISRFDTLGQYIKNINLR